MKLTFTRKTSACLIIFFWATLPFEKASSEDLNKLISAICLSGFNAEMKIAERNPPQEVGDFTCNCFVEKFTQGIPLAKAKESCKEEASNHFNL